MSHLALQLKKLYSLQKLLADLDVDISRPVTIYEDNQSAIAVSPSMSKNARQKRRKHIEAIQNGTIRIEYCSTTQMVADILTKPLPLGQFNIIRMRLGLA